MRLVIDSHRDVVCHDESFSYEALLKGAGHSDLESSRLMVGYKVPRYSEQLLWEVNVDPHYGKNSGFYRDEKVVFIIRNPLDVISSMMNLNAGGLSWFGRYAKNILRSSIYDGPDRFSFRAKFDALENCNAQDYQFAALYWEVKNFGAIELLEAKKRIIIISYEDIVRSPSLYLRKVTDFLGLSWDVSILAHNTINHGELEDNGLAIGNTDPTRAIDSSSVGQYKKTLTESQSGHIMEILGSSIDILQRCAKA